MSLLQVIPTIFYADLSVGIKFFADGLGFKEIYNDGHLSILKRDTTTLHLQQNEKCAKGERPEIRISTDDIEAYYNEIRSRNPALLHPNSNTIKSKPWGLKEFALLDETTVCIIIQQPID